MYTDTEIYAAVDATGLRSILEKLHTSNGDDDNNNNNNNDDGMKDTSHAADKPAKYSHLCEQSTVDTNLLEGMVEESGMNFSTGERQLVCLCRAVLQRNKLLVMDEATANIDLKTDMAIQNAIYREFTSTGTTVITIAHRLHTVIDYDQILVLAKGRLVENGSPWQLLSQYFGDIEGYSNPNPNPNPNRNDDYHSNQNTHTRPRAVSSENILIKDLLPLNNVKAVKPPRHSFASLVKQTGPEMCLKLRILAKDADDRRQKEK